MERDGHTAFILANVYNFNSHAHVERDDSREQKWGHIEISTHTLTWSVTLTADGGVDNYVISTHTLTWSVTGNDI